MNNHQTTDRPSLSLSEVQARISDTAIYPTSPTFDVRIPVLVEQEEVGLMRGETLTVKPPIYPFLGLANEAGEVLGKVKKALRGDAPANREALLAEVFDVIWYASECATALSASLDEVVEAGLTKLQDRKSRNVLHGNGDNR